MTASDHVRVVLESVSTKLTGTYLCEVTVTPTFFALAETANMTVIGKLMQANIFHYNSDCLLRLSSRGPGDQRGAKAVPGGGDRPSVLFRAAIQSPITSFVVH